MTIYTTPAFPTAPAAGDIWVPGNGQKFRHDGAKWKKQLLSDLNTITGMGAPTSGLGNLGDYYYDIANVLIYGPKTVGGWGAGSSWPGGSGGSGGSGGGISYTASATAPASPAEGDEWWSTTKEVLFKRILGNWIDISSSLGGSATSGPRIVAAYGFGGSYNVASFSGTAATFVTPLASNTYTIIAVPGITGGATGVVATFPAGGMSKSTTGFSWTTATGLADNGSSGEASGSAQDKIGFIAFL